MKDYQQLKKEFDALNEKEQWEWALKHKDEITITLDNDNTDFTFDTENKDEDVTLFFFKDWIGTAPASQLVLSMLGFKSQDC